MNAQLHRKNPLLSKPTILTLSILALIALLGFFGPSFPRSGPNAIIPTGLGMGIMHIVMFEFKEEATEGEVADVCTRMLALREQCVHPESKQPYLKMGIGGKQNSLEGISGGISHVFLSEFANEEDRKYYLEKDPVHLAFVKSIGGGVKKVQVVDFDPGVF